VDLALFYERNNLLLNGDVGWVPGTVWGEVVEGLPEMAQACNDLWRSGAAGETHSALTCSDLKVAGSTRCSCLALDSEMEDEN
jgi:hypothetical protein